MDACLSSLYNEYERQYRDLFLNDWESLLGQAQALNPDLPADAHKDECANIIMEYSRLGKRIAELEQKS